MYHFLHMVRDKGQSVILQVLQALASSRTLGLKLWTPVPLSLPSSQALVSLPAVTAHPALGMGRIGGHGELALRRKP